MHTLVRSTSLLALSISIAATLCLTCREALGQNAAPDRPARGQQELTLLDDTGIGATLTAGRFVSSSSVTVNGVRITKVNDNGRQFKFEEDPASGITCYISERYTPDDLDRLEKEQPELFMHLSAIPATLGDSTIRVTIDVETKYHAANVEELEQKHPAAFQYFDKYVRHGAENAAEIHLQHLGEPLRIRAGRGERPVVEPAPPAAPATDDDK